MEPDSSVRKVLIFRLGSLGDAVVALPCFHLIERVFPQAERTLLTNFPVHAKAPAAAAVLGNSGLIHDYLRYTAGTRSIGEMLRLAWKIRRLRPDVLVYVMPVRPAESVKRDRLFFRLAGVRRIIGLPGSEESKQHFDPDSGLYESEASRLARALVALGDAGLGEQANWSLRLTEEERSVAVSALNPLAGRPFIACGPGTKMQAKDWGPENWQRLLTVLHEKYPEHGLALFGAKEDAEVSEYAAHGWNGAKVNLCGVLSPRETAAALEEASVFLGPDSGPMHLAACSGVPCVIAFSARGLPGVWYPEGSNHRIIYHQVNCFGCYLETCIAEGRKCLTSILVDEMAAAVDSVLSQKA